MLRLGGLWGAERVQVRLPWGKSGLVVQEQEHGARRIKTLCSWRLEEESGRRVQCTKAAWQDLLRLQLLPAGGGVRGKCRPRLCGGERTRHGCAALPRGGKAHQGASSNTIRARYLQAATSEQQRVESQSGPAWTAAGCSRRVLARPQMGSRARLPHERAVTQKHPQPRHGARAAAGPPASPLRRPRTLPSSRCCQHTCPQLWQGLKQR